MRLNSKFKFVYYNCYCILLSFSWTSSPAFWQRNSFFFLGLVVASRFSSSPSGFFLNRIRIIFRWSASSSWFCWYPFRHCTCFTIYCSMYCDVMTIVETAKKTKRFRSSRSRELSKGRLNSNEKIKKAKKDVDNRTEKCYTSRANKQT